MSYNRKKEDNKRLEKLCNETNGSLEGGAYFSPFKKRLVRFYKSDYKHYRYIKKQFHKKLRRSETLSNKEYDVKWNLY